MLEVYPVNLVQAGGLTIGLFGLYLLKDYKHYFVVRMLLTFSCLSSVANFSEEVLGTRDWYLLSPVVLVGIGPMFYLCACSLANTRFDVRNYLHLLPMLLALPFTQHTQVIIALGTLSFVLYGVAIFRLVNAWEKRIRAQRSNAEDLSLNWFMRLSLATALVYAFDLTRLNLQQQLGLYWNTSGQLVANIAIFMILAYLIKKLLQFNDELLSFQQEFKFGVENTQQVDTGSNTEESAFAEERFDTEESSDEYKTLFQHIEQQMREKHLYRQPRFSLLQLAEETGLQSRDISRAINLCGQVNFNDYINQHRVNAIKQDLEQRPELSLLEIGLQGGFNSKTSFNNVFKRLTGMTPGQFRSQQ